MRVTERAIFETARTTSAAARERYAAAGERASSGIALDHPWDGPGAGRVAREKVAAAQASAIATVAERTGDELEATDHALEQVIETLSNAAALAIQMASSTFNAADRQRAAGQVRTQLQSAIAALNLDVAGRFVLGGTQDQAAPFDATTGAYLGDAGVRRIEVAPGILTDASVRADKVIAGAGGGVDVLAALGRFAAALDINDVAGIRASIGEIQASVAQVALGRSEIGSMELSAEAAAITARTLEAGALARKSAITDVDFIDAATELALAERSLDATIAVSAKSFELSLLDRL